MSKHAICSPSGAILSREATEKMGPAKMATAIIGSGADVLTDWHPGHRITLEQNLGFGLLRNRPYPLAERRNFDPQIRRSLTHSQTPGERDPNRISLELVAVSCCHFQFP